MKNIKDKMKDYQIDAIECAVKVQIFDFVAKKWFQILNKPQRIYDMTNVYGKFNVGSIVDFRKLFI
eukprot:UN04802